MYIYSIRDLGFFIFQTSERPRLSLNVLRFDKQEKFYPCALCNLSFSTDSGRMLHTWTHRGNTYQSVNYNHNLPQSEGFSFHLNEGIGEKSIESEAQDKASSWFIASSYTEENLPQCVSCKKTFHPGENNGENYECQECQAKKHWFITGL